MSRTEQEPSDNPYAAPRAALADAPPLGPTPGERKWFFRSFWVSFLIGFIAFAVLLGGHDPYVFAMMFFAMIPAGIVHLACLARMASRTGKSGLMWVLGAVLFAPIGYLVTFARMSMLIGLDEEEATQEAAPAE